MDGLLHDRRCRSRFGNGISRRCRFLCDRSFAKSAFSSCVVDDDTRLDIIAEHVIENAISVILNGLRLHKYAVSYQIRSFKDWRDAVHNMVVCFLYIVGNHIFKWQHSRNIQITSARDKIPCICIFSRKLIAQQMAAIIQVFAINAVILYGMPSCWFYLTDRTPLLGRHNILTHASVCHAAAPQFVQLGVELVRICSHVAICEEWDIVVNRYIWISTVSRNHERIGRNRVHRVCGRTCFCRHLNDFRLSFNDFRYCAFISCICCVFSAWFINGFCIRSFRLNIFRYSCFCLNSFFLS